MNLTKEELKEKFNKHIKISRINFNSDEKKVDEVIDSLLKRNEKFGEPFCPCRLITNNPEIDKEIICPCVFHRGEIELQGHCLCGLFIK